MDIGMNPWKQHVPLWVAAWALVLALLIGYWAGSFARPQADRWHFDHEQNGLFLIRVDKTTGKAERLVQNGWYEIGSNPPKTAN
jgi:hypothetical protein